MSVGSGTTWTPGRAHRSGTSVVEACRCDDPVAWRRRVLLTVALLFGLLLLMAAWSGAARADHVPAEETSEDGSTPALSTSDGETSESPDDAGTADATESDAAESDAADGADATDGGDASEEVVVEEGGDAEAAPEPPADDGTVASSDDAVAPLSPDTTGSTAEATPVDPTAAASTSEATTSVPVTDPALTDPALTDPALAAPVAVVPPVAVPVVPVPPADIPAALFETPVDPALTESATAPGQCREPEAGTVVVRASTGTGLVAPARGRGAAPDTSTPADTNATSVSADQGIPAGPAGPPTPVRLPTPLPTPAPAGPTGPVGSSTAASSGTYAFGAGQHQQADSIDAVLDARVAASLAQAALRPASGFAGAVVGGADDPGVRPG